MVSVFRVLTVSKQLLDVCKTHTFEKLLHSEKVSAVTNPYHQVCLTELNDSNSNKKPKNHTVLVSFLKYL